MLLLDVEHRKMVQEARNDFGFIADEDDNELCGTSFAPCRDNGTPGKYYCRFKGHELDRSKVLDLMGQDMQEGNTDSNGNGPCFNEVFEDVPYTANFLDFDLESTAANGEWLRGYALFMLDVLRKSATAPLGRKTQIVITTMLDKDGKFRSYDQDFLKCPYCRGEVVAQTTGQRFHVCHDCNTKWRHVPSRERPPHEEAFAMDDDEDDDDGDELGGNAEQNEGLFLLHTRGQSARGKRKVGDIAVADIVDGTSSSENQPQPTRFKCRKVSAHFRIQGVLMTQRACLMYLHILRLKSYAYDRSISIEQWDKALDVAPNQRKQLRLTLTDKAAVCPTCKGNCTVARDGNHVPCLTCFETGRIILPAKRHEIFDVLYERPPNGGAAPAFLGDLASIEPHRYSALWERHTEDFPFILKLCSIAVPIQGAERLEIKGDGQVPSDKRDVQPLRGAAAVRGARTARPTVQARAWRQSERGAKQFLSERMHESVRRLIIEAEPRYGNVAVRDAFYTDAAQRCIIVHFDGVGATFCKNKLSQQLAEVRRRAEARAAQGSSSSARSAAVRRAGEEAVAKAAQNSTLGYHASSRAWAMITCSSRSACALSFRCFNRAYTKNARTGAVCGCGKWKGSRRSAVSEDLAVMLFPKQRRCGATTGESENATSGANADVSAHGQLAQKFPLLEGFGGLGSMRHFLHTVASTTNRSGALSPYNPFQQNADTLTIDQPLEFFQSQHFRTKQSCVERLEDDDEWATVNTADLNDGSFSDEDVDGTGGSNLRAPKERAAVALRKRMCLVRPDDLLWIE